jgi:hypothetical protein
MKERLLRSFFIYDFAPWLFRMCFNCYFGSQITLVHE